MASKQALILGASGISGWAIARECLTYLSTSSFTRVIALSKNKLEKTEFLLPEEDIKRLDVYHGIDLTQGVELVVEALRKYQPLSRLPMYTTLVSLNQIPSLFTSSRPLTTSYLFSLHRPRKRFSDPQGS